MHRKFKWKNAALRTLRLGVRIIPGVLHCTQTRKRMTMLSDSTIKNQHCGIIAGTREEVQAHMPDMVSVLKTAPCWNDPSYRYDIKVHMLMPGQWPCIPGWHKDFVPRDDDKTMRPDLIPDDPPIMFLWVSGEPLTQFRYKDDGDEFIIKNIEPKKWTAFTQHDEHRGTESKEHTWRVIIRATPEEIVPPHAMKLGPLRRHSQVYLNAENFKW